MNQIITIRTDGSIFGMDHKKKGMDLRQFGKASVKRETLIEWEEEHQAWSISWFLTGGLIIGSDTSLPWSYGEIPEEILDYQIWGEKIMVPEGKPIANMTPILFREYDDAVAFEVAVIQHLQQKGELVA